MFFRYNRPVLIWALFILIICGIPGHAVPTINFWQWLKWDKLVHLGIYLVLSLLAVRGFSLQRTFARLHQFPRSYALVLCSLYGGLIEILQATVFIDRSGDVRDAIANSLGALAGVLLFDRAAARVKWFRA